MYDPVMGVMRFTVGVVPLLVVVRQAHIIVLTNVNGPVMGVTIMCTITFIWHSSKLIVSGCEAE